MIIIKPNFLAARQRHDRFSRFRNVGVILFDIQQFSNSEECAMTWAAAVAREGKFCSANIRPVFDLGRPLHLVPSSIKGNDSLIMIGVRRSFLSAKPLFIVRILSC